MYEHIMEDIAWNKAGCKTLMGKINAWISDVQASSCASVNCESGDAVE